MGPSTEVRGATPAAHSLNSPCGAFWDGQRLYIAGCDNNRVVIYNVLTKALLASQAGDAADAVLGQSAFNAAAASGPGGLNRPEGVWVEGSRIGVADSNDNRIAF
ncbi:MAG: hypothetical protein RMK29_16385 [Myxococcales bacterium]|nr:hypothetical protein [Myxococcota bacterium]MDW8283291.1 hypothetical protein [Myxococcales bacterium]